MKRIFLFMLVIAFALSPAFCFADDYCVNNDELTISFDTPKWTVFTRDNLQDEKATLKKLGTKPKEMMSTMKESGAYVVAVKNGKKKREEVLVRVQSNEYINSMNTLSDKELKALKNGVDEKWADELKDYDSSLYHADENEYIRMTGDYDKEHHVIQYFTIVNGREYLIAAQKVVDYTQADIEELEAIAGGATFKVDESLTENDLDGYIAEQQESLSNPITTKVRVFGVIVVVICVAAALYLKNRRRNRKMAKMGRKK